MRENVKLHASEHSERGGNAGLQTPIVSGLVGTVDGLSSVMARSSLRKIATA